MKKVLANFCYYSQLHKAFSPFYGGHVSIILLHRISATPLAEEDPLKPLSISQAALEQYIQEQRNHGWDFISIDELHADFDRLTRKGKHLLITLDDGYRDNYSLGYPLFKKYEIPFVLYVTNSFPNGAADLWWESLADTARWNQEIVLSFPWENVRITGGSTCSRYNALQAHFMGLAPHQQAGFVAALQQQYPPTGSSQSLCLSWEEIRTLAGDPLCTIGGHTMSHRSLRALDDQEAADEIVNSKVEIERLIGRSIRHFAYPYGKSKQVSPRDVRLVQDAGFATAVTTNIGNIFPEHKHLSYMLPRIPLYEGEVLGKLSKIYQSGMYGALANRMRRVVTL